MKNRNWVVLGMMLFISATTGHAAEDSASLGAQAGAAARELKETADQSYKTGAAKAAEVTQKVEVQTQDALKTLRQQWDVLAKQLQEKTQQAQKQIEQQWKDFQKSFNSPKS